MTVPKFDTARFERACQREEIGEIEDRRTQDDAFQAALRCAIRRGRESAVEGTFVDASPPINLVWFARTPARSDCGSPGQMCAESGGAVDGGRTFK